MSAWRKIPSAERLAARLLDINEAFSHPDGGPATVYLFREGTDSPEWVVGASTDGWPYVADGVEIPGNDTFTDAEALDHAKCMLSSYRNHGATL